MSLVCGYPTYEGGYCSRRINGRTNSSGMCKQHEKLEFNSRLHLLSAVINGEWVDTEYNVYYSLFWSHRNNTTE